MNKIVILITIFCFLLSGCQETPEESSIASRADGLDKDIILKELPEGETQALDVPENWVFTEKKSNDRVTIGADIYVDKIVTGNLPVIEMKQHKLTEKELEDLVNYFSEGEVLLVPEKNTKQDYQEVIDRINNREICYESELMSSFDKELENKLRDVIRLADERKLPSKKVEVKFDTKQDDTAWDELMDWRKLNGYYVDDKDFIKDKKIFFSADVGEERLAHIDASRYDKDAGSCSRFLWYEGTTIYNSPEDLEDLINYEQVTSAYESESYISKEINLYNQLKSVYEQEAVSEQKAIDLAEVVLQELGISYMELHDIDNVIWLPRSAAPDPNTMISPKELYWKSDISKAEAGYILNFSRKVEEIATTNEHSIISSNELDSYAPPFPVETISIVITGDGTKSFDWKGMAEESKEIAPNTNLMSFEKIQERLVDQVFLWYSSKNQPADDRTEFNYDVKELEFGYTYTAAYDSPDNSWLVPAWIFKVIEGQGDISERRTFVINALDGSVIRGE